MSRMEQPTADDVILDLLVDGVEPTHDNLMATIAAHPKHRDALVAFFANLAVQTALGDDLSPAGCSVEQFANIGLSRVLANRQDTLRGDAQGAGDRLDPPLPAPSARLSQFIKAKGLTEAEVATRTGLDAGLMMKLDRRRITGRRPMELFRRIAAELHIPPAYVIATATGPPIASSAGNLRKAKGQIEIGTETFEAAISASTLSDDLKTFWLERMADEDEPSA